MNLVDRLRIRQAIALIVVLPMVVGVVAVALLAASQHRNRVEAIEELEDLERLMVALDLESALTIERSNYQAWMAVEVPPDVTPEDAFLLSAVEASITMLVIEAADGAIESVGDASFSAEQRRDLDSLVAGWLQMRAAYADNDEVGLAEATERLDAMVSRLDTIIEATVARRGARWLPIHRQARFDLASAEELPFIALTVVSGATTEQDRRAAALLIDHSNEAYQDLIAVSSIERQATIDVFQRSDGLAEFRRQALLESPTMSIGEALQTLSDLADRSQGASGTRVETAEAVRLQAQSEADAATRKRNLAVGIGCAVVLGPLLLVTSVGGRLSRRLERVAADARRVSLGAMDFDLEDVTGRDEIAEVSAAFNDVAETIARAHDQILALAEGRTDDVLLDHELPGVIGQTLRLALRRLGNATSELAHQANHDKLTGLLDRRGLQAGIDRLGRRDGDVGAGTARGMILVDLDDFKQVNDVHGHAAGDAVLREMARRMMDCTRARDLVARLGGDEFLVLTSEFETCEVMAQRLAEQIAEPFEWSGLMLSVTASIGWTPVVAGEDFEDVLHRADKAMYTAKRSGKNRSLPS